MRISDWSSDVCSSDLGRTARPRRADRDRCVVAPAGEDDGAFEAADPARQGLLDHLRSPGAGAEAAAGAVRAQRLRDGLGQRLPRSEEHTSELQSLMRISYAVFCLKKNNNKKNRPLES